jgi:hypothetical protein
VSEKVRDADYGFGNGSSHGSGDGYGFSSGYGYGFSSGYGDGSADGDGSGFGDGSGYGFGAGFGDVFSFGSGAGFDFGFGEGDGCDDGAEVIIERKGRVKRQTGRAVVVRGNRSSSWFGWLKSRKGPEVVLTNARRIWYWSGAASLSELAMRGVKDPKNCKFPEAVGEVLILDAIEIIPASKAAWESLQAVPVWSAKEGK